VRLRHIAAGTVVVVATALGVPAAASAATAATASSVPWPQYRTAPWTDAPGAVCTFGVTTKILVDQEQSRTLASYPNGNSKLQEFRGPLIVRYTNTTTNESIVRDLSGYAWFRYGPTGGIDAFVASHIDVTVPVGNTGYPAGEWVLTGQSLVSIDSSGTINVQLLRATAENLCSTLS
jgi:hypothetical protein